MTDEEKIAQVTAKLIDELYVGQRVCLGGRPDILGTVTRLETYSSNKYEFPSSVLVMVDCMKSELPYQRFVLKPA